MPRGKKDVLSKLAVLRQDKQFCIAERQACDALKGTGVRYDSQNGKAVGYGNAPCDVWAELVQLRQKVGSLTEALEEAHDLIKHNLSDEVTPYYNSTLAKAEKAMAA